ncbi:hypothetical protein GF340_04250 [Candidatus Peregrinibacteria bacterium]|nr:hypothetical protein [Candidatus Peregrinibacteria bacterium]
MLITSGEENGVVAARYLVENVSNISDTLQEHQFMVEFDLDGKNEFKTYEVGSAEFVSYIAGSTGFKNRGKNYWTDIVVLCKDICGVNLSIGYYDNETPQEYVNENDWLTILKIVRKWLGQENLPRFLREE